jgi:uracil-DNA glycosylase
MVDTATVYLEDVAVTKSAEELKPAATVTATRGGSAVKRQLTLADMFGGASQSKPSVAKKQKLSQSTTPSASASSQPSAPECPQATDEVLFSIASFQESLSDEQKELLGLECEVMGESWQVTWLETSKNNYLSPFPIG